MEGIQLSENLFKRRRKPTILFLRFLKCYFSRYCSSILFRVLLHLSLSRRERPPRRGLTGLGPALPARKNVKVVEGSSPALALDPGAVVVRQTRDQRSVQGLHRLQGVLHLQGPAVATVVAGASSPSQVRLCPLLRLRPLGMMAFSIQ